MFAQVAGALDNTFNGTGKVTTRVGSLDAFGEATAIQNDGKIVVAGYASNGTNYQFALLRYNSDGSLDKNFGNNGTVVTYYGDSISYGYAAAIQPDGRIVVAGTYYSGLTQYDDFMVARYNTDGSPDNSFGTGGIVTTDFGNSDDYGEAIAIQPDGKIVVAGSSDIYNVPYDISSFALARYNANGTLDTTFGIKGLTATNFYNYNNYGHSITLQSNGKILIAGSSSNIDTITVISLACYTSNGILDSTFAVNGIDTVSIGKNAIGNGVVLQQDGRIVVAGSADNNFALLRFNADGYLDTTFGVKGVDTLGFGTSLAVGNSTAIQADSEIVMAGSIGSAFALARYKYNGTPDSIFGKNGKVTTAFTGVDDEAYSVAIQPDGKIIAVGYTEIDTVFYFATARYIPTITLGIVDIAGQNNSALVYPNPVNDMATLDYSLAKNEIITIKIYDMMGRLVQTIISDTNEGAGEYHQPINLESLPKGDYTLSLTNKSFNLVSIKLIKQ